MRPHWRAAAFLALLINLVAWGQVPDAALSSASADEAPDQAVGQDQDPTRQLDLSLAELRGTEGGITLRGDRSQTRLQFGMRQDQVATSAVLNLHYTPSPALLSDVSHLRVRLNDELVGIAPIERTAPGQSQTHRLSLDPRLIGDRNQLVLELIGHYTDTCEDPVHSSLWVEIRGTTHLSIDTQPLPLANDLARLPAPFLDVRDSRPLTLPFVLPPTPDLEVQRAGAILAAYFGMHADWRGQHFPVTFDTPPRTHSVVLATNDRRPPFLSEHPAVEGPTVEIISHPETPYAKLLVVMGRDADELVQAARGVALGSILLRGQSARIQHVAAVAPRRPYDAPRWVDTDHPVTFDRLMEYSQQLQTEGREPPPVTLSLRVPPDLFIWRNENVAMRIGFRHTPTQGLGGSRLDISLNDQFLDALPLDASHGEPHTVPLSLPLLTPLTAAQSHLDIPGLKLGSQNRLRFDFRYADRLGSEERGGCQTVMPIPHQASIDEDSTIDFSGYPHYLAMPSLEAFVSAGFPFSRLADLSETLVVVPQRPSSVVLSTLFEGLARIAAQTGYPGVAVTLSHDWTQARAQALDVLSLAGLPDDLPDREAAVALGETGAQLRLAAGLPPAGARATSLNAPRQADSEVSVSADGPFAAIVGLASPWQAQRSIVAMLADTPKDHRLLNATLNDNASVASIHGSVVLIREGDVSSQQIGQRYYVGRLGWLTWLRYHLSPYPLPIALLSMVSMLLVAGLLWRLLRRRSQHRLNDFGGE